MNHPWQQPIRPMHVRRKNDDGSISGLQVDVLFIRPLDNGWQVITMSGTSASNLNALLVYGEAK